MADDSAPAHTPELGRYQLRRLLGRGGMGEVHLAYDSSLDREVAVKFIAPDKTADAEARRRFLREARAAAALDHPGICTVYETGETADGRTYIVMQYVEGQPLTDVLRGGVMPVRGALVLCAQIAEALGAAHRRNIVHRDLKPGNVILTTNGKPKIVDFGLAKLLIAAAAMETEPTTTATTAGVIVGTASYMSPEQAQQRPVDGRSDLFSLGALLYECLTGRRAFAGATSLETLANVIHVHPPPPSRLRSELDDRHDELCRRLLAKDPADRFQSAEEVVGAISILVPDSSRSAVSADSASGSRPQPSALNRRNLVLGLTAAGCLTIGGGFVWLWPEPSLPAAPADAETWYRRGTEALREGAYYTAAKSLETAVAIFPEYTLAHARLGEARAELDDQRLAMDSLLRVVVPTRLARVERLRLEAVKALVMRDIDAAIASYSELTRLNPQDAGVWLDLGRAQEAGGLMGEARASYKRSIEADGQYAAAYVRLGQVEALNSRRDEAIAAFAEAERLYQTSIDIEGQAEVLLRRGAMFDSFGEVKAARADLERALSLATDVKSQYQQVRARLSLSSVTFTEGRFADAARAATSAVQDALTQGLETVAADGLIDLASVMQSGALPEAEAHLQRAIQLAELRGARRTAARGRVQLAGIYQEQGRPREALDLLATVLPFLSANRYRRFELLGRSIAARAHLAIDELDEAAKISATVLNLAETMTNDGQVALAATNLARVRTALGDYPTALRLRVRAEEIHRRQGDNEALPFDLTNRAELLIQLGRSSEASVALGDLEAGMTAKIESYLRRERRATFLRALAEITALKCGTAMPPLRRLEGMPGTDTTAAVGAALRTFCDAFTTRRGNAADAPANLDPTAARERLSGVALAAVHRGQPADALDLATSGLKLLGNRSNDELRWRLAAVGSVAARQLGNQSIFAGLSTTAREALARVRTQWQSDYQSYAQRRDLEDLRKRAELN
jgi:tetratricopeptide (TPR) repeat protein